LDVERYAQRIVIEHNGASRENHHVLNADGLIDVFVMDESSIPRDMTAFINVQSKFLQENSLEVRWHVSERHELQALSDPPRVHPRIRLVPKQ
jgi:hypothetical protein